MFYEQVEKRSPQCIVPRATNIFFLVKKSPSLWCMAAEDPLPCSENTVNGSGPAAFEPSQHLYAPFCNLHFRIILRAVSSFWFSDHKNIRPRTYLFFYIFRRAFDVSYSFICTKEMQSSVNTRCIVSIT
jgi:hypothetical protein